MVGGVGLHTVSVGIRFLETTCTYGKKRVFAKHADAIMSLRVVYDAPSQIMKFGHSRMALWFPFRWVYSDWSRGAYRNANRTDPVPKWWVLGFRLGSHYFWVSRG